MSHTYLLEALLTVTKPMSPTPLHRPMRPTQLHKPIGATPCTAHKPCSLTQARGPSPLDESIRAHTLALACIHFALAQAHEPHAHAQARKPRCPGP
eukprot:1159870-Pelagomonas_calceolata.AAC.17